MRFLSLLFCFTLPLQFNSCARKGGIPADIIEGYPESMTVSVRNPEDFPRAEKTFSLNTEDLGRINSSFNPQAFVVFDGNIEIASQRIDPDGDGAVDKIVCQTDFAANETKDLTVRFAKSGATHRAYTQRAYGELSHKTGGRFEQGIYLTLPPEAVPDLKLGFGYKMMEASPCPENVIPPNRSSIC